MNSRQLAVLVALVAGVAVPAAAHATEPVRCTPERTRDADPGTASAIRFGVCITGTGYVEVGISTGSHQGQVYVVASSDRNGYAGVSSYESSGSDSQPCGPVTPGGSEGGSGSNAGGCYGTDGIQVDLTQFSGTVPLPVCGDDTGAWYNSSRNGCRIDNQEINAAVAKAIGTVLCIVADPVHVIDCVLANYP